MIEKKVHTPVFLGVVILLVLIAIVIIRVMQ